MKHAELVNKYGVEDEVLFVGMELSKKTWKLCFQDNTNRRIVDVQGGDVDGFMEAARRTKEIFKLKSDCPIVACYEAGGDGFWICRALRKRGVEIIVVDPASIETSRRGRRRKNDRLDAEKLCRMLVRYVRGETKHWSELRIPTAEQEDERRLTRERQQLVEDSRRLTCRIKSLLRLEGLILQPGWHKNFANYLEEVRDRMDEPLRPNLKAELGRTFERLACVRAQLKLLDKEIDRRIRESEAPAYQQVRAMKQLQGIGRGVTVLSLELFWRTFRNGREVGASVGLTPTPYNTGESEIEQGISKAGNCRIRWLMIQLAWLWIRYQPDSDITLWFNERFGQGKRLRKIGIVAVARRLLVALWRYVTFGEVPAGAQFKSTETKNTKNSRKAGGE
jgi:transposase